MAFNRTTDQAVRRHHATYQGMIVDGTLEAGALAVGAGSCASIFGAGQSA